MTAPTDATSHNCPTLGSPDRQALVAGLRERGYIQGQNLVIECRWTARRAERAPALAAELVSLKVALILANGTASVRATQQATSTIPIVRGGTDPVGRGLAANFARPGGNLMGLTSSAGPEIAGQYLQLLKEAVPKASRVAVLNHRPSPLAPRSGYLRETKAAAQAFDVTLESYEVQSPEEFEGAFTAMTKARAEALLVLLHPLFLNARRIIDLAAQGRLPSMYPFTNAVRDGGLMGYEANQPDIHRRLGSSVEKIFNRANPGDLPVEQPTKYELPINLKTGKALGLTIPPSLRMRADEVIE